MAEAWLTAVASVALAGALATSRATWRWFNGVGREAWSFADMQRPTPRERVGALLRRLVRRKP